MIDTHAHIYLPELQESFSDLIFRAKEVGITAILMPGIELASFKQMQECHQQTDFPIFSMFGIHPCEVKGFDKNLESQLNDYCSKEEVIAIGETGLDYYWSKDFIEEQKYSLRVHCKVAKELSKPIVLHNRDSTSDILDLIEAEQDGCLFGVWHCFTGNLDEGKRAIDLGLHLGIGGVVTFKNGGVDKFINQLPLDKLVLETDTPYLAPVPHRGKPNEPSYLSLVCSKLASVYNSSFEEMDRITTQNAKSLFSI